MSNLYNLALFSAVRDEARFLREWLEYHFLPGVGVEHVFLYVNDDPGSQEFRDTESVLAPYVRAGLVDYIYHPTYRDPQWQLKVWRDLLSTYGWQCRWGLLTDADCFLFPAGPESVLHVLGDFEDSTTAALAVYTCTFGSSGLVSVSRQTDELIRRAPLGHPSNWTANYILRPARLEPPTVEAGYGVPKPRCRIMDTSGTDLTGVKRKRPGPMNRLRLNHYSVRSSADWARKVSRGWPESDINWSDPNHTIAQHKLAMLDRNEELDDSLPRRFGESLKAALL